LGRSTGRSEFREKTDALYWLANLFNHIDLPLKPKDFSKEEAADALRILLKEKEIRDHLLVPSRELAHQLSVDW
jgi:hypothetical protein